LLGSPSNSDWLAKPYGKKRLLFSAKQATGFELGNFFAANNLRQNAVSTFQNRWPLKPAEYCRDSALSPCPEAKNGLSRLNATTRFCQHVGVTGFELHDFLLPKHTGNRSKNRKKTAFDV
jgi:hypothetical protein